METEQAARARTGKEREVARASEEKARAKALGEAGGAGVHESGENVRTLHGGRDVQGDQPQEVPSSW